MDYVENIKAELAEYIDQEKAEFLPRFFNAIPGGYGEGDRFLGIRVPDQRKVARKYYRKISLEGARTLLQSEFHEHRLTALIILVHKFEKARSEEEKKAIVDLYLDNLDYVNNWDLVDTSADKILGAYLVDKDRSLLYQLARTDHLWKQRIAIMATFYFIRNNDFTDTLEIARILLNHEHDLIHKAVGWMLREVGRGILRLNLSFCRSIINRCPGQCSDMP